jgi:hypothetical protein
VDILSSVSRYGSNVYRAGYPEQMHQEKTHQHREHMYVNAHILLAN